MIQSMQFELFTHSAGKVEFGWFRKTVTNYIITSTDTIEPGNDNGFDGQHAGYLLNTQDNGGKGQFEGFELSGRQSLQPYLKFLPEIARGWDIFDGCNTSRRTFGTNYSLAFRANLDQLKLPFIDR
jgi:hypothetical protein